jgi:excisionase family DNA binding protein
MRDESDNNFERLLSPEDVARTCGLSRRAVYRAIARGELRAARLCHRLRVQPTELERWIGEAELSPESRQPRRSHRSTSRARAVACVPCSKTLRKARRPTVSVERVERKGGVVWRVRWRDEQGRARSKVVGRKRDADAFEAEVVRRKRTGDLDLLTGGRQTLADFAQEWWKLYAAPNLAARTLRSYAGLWDRHVLPRLGSMRLSSITPEVIERFRAELEADGVGQPTIYRALALLQGIMRRAVEWRRIGHNPVKAVQKPKVRRHREVRPLPPFTVERLRAVAAKRRKYGARDATLIALLAYAGLRPQEAQALRWGDVRERTLLIEKAADGQGGVKPTKTGQARTVRPRSPLARDLAELRLLRGRPDDDVLLFPSGSGGVWNDPAWQTCTGTRGCPHVVPLAWRAHVPTTFATALSRC